MASGLSYTALLDRLIELAIERHAERESFKDEFHLKTISSAARRNFPLVLSNSQTVGLPRPSRVEPAADSRRASSCSRMGTFVEPLMTS